MTVESKDVADCRRKAKSKRKGKRAKEVGEAEELTQNASFFFRPLASPPPYPLPPSPLTVSSLSAPDTPVCLFQGFTEAFILLITEPNN